MKKIKSERKLITRAWRKQFKAWGMGRRECIREARIHAAASCEGEFLSPILTAGDADDAVAEELTYWGD
ncbi:hypothetical protein QJS26_gp05 [Serratia phage vB_SmaS_Stoker]|uniref:Uncharacterized protein n=1 Tax=Serratia phage vB_SmaS_Stoker TaxID=2902692 RepID=A0AC61TQB2_9CAUD|nr:hypothetical protein QJS26_gp05 [Serratia phage vB_SmaS_Stoker]UGO53752.1 hypothetical protein STOKER_5 [Serratia phage vB_SmaS_Stoker]